ncbi:putative Glucosidase II beta subunit-like [Trypanosoma cruzi]|nr:putative Glucosidase II beta subunit-like [Trypanosoma cruzi]
MRRVNRDGNNHGAADGPTTPPSEQKQEGDHHHHHHQYQRRQQQQERGGGVRLRGPPMQARQPQWDGSGVALWSLVGAVVVLLVAMLLPWKTLLDDWSNWDEGSAEQTLLQAPPPRRYTDVMTHSEDTRRQEGEAKGRPEPSCYTLEAYSMKFIAPAQRQEATPQHFYRCGTRLIDLNTEVNRSKREICTAATEKSPTLFSTLRVYLESAFEEKAHLKQRDNVAAQTISLERVNDDYCDCLDGTDELQTSACSMSGTVLPLAHMRWKQYLLANAHIQLYEEEEAPSMRRTERLLRRLGGPVLPFRCRSDPDVWLAPSRVGDGVVDCCDGSDEATSPKHHPTHEVQGEDSWRSRVTAMEPYLGMHSGAASPLYPMASGNRTVAAMLLENGFTSLMSCRRVKEERLNNARTLHEVVKRGNAIHKDREANGWEKYGKKLVEHIARKKTELDAASKEFETRRSQIAKQMEKMGKSDPISAGISPEEVQAMNQMYAELQKRGESLRLVVMILSFRWLGDDFEYYPLADAHFTVPVNRVLETARSTSPEVQRVQASRRYNDSYVIESIPVHVDNTSYRKFSFYPCFYLVGARNLTKEQSAIIIKRAYGLEENESLNVSGTENFEESLPVVFGFWRPDLSEVTIDNFQSVDPSGNGVLRRRLFMSEPAPVMGGVEQILQHERLSYGGRHRRVMRLGPTDLREQLQQALQGATNDTGIEMPQQKNTPDLASVRIFSGGIPCALDDAMDNSGRLGEEEEEEKENTPRSHGRVVYVCDEEDLVLEWHRNGKCAHEVVFGTPSACPPWVKEASAARVRQAEEALQYDE